MSNYNLNVSYSGSASSLQLTSVEPKLAEYMTRLFLSSNGITVVNFKMPNMYEDLTLYGSIDYNLIEVYLNAG